MPDRIDGDAGRPAIPIRTRSVTSFGDHSGQAFYVYYSRATLLVHQMCLPEFFREQFRVVCVNM
jgi:hypothetical protein